MQITKIAYICIIFSFFLVILGCGFMPMSPQKALPGEEVITPTKDLPAQTAVPENQPAPVEAVSAAIPAVDTSVNPAETTPADATNASASDSLSNTSVTQELKLSGSLIIQEDTSLCPHLTSTFSCDKYDLRGCGFSTLMGTSGFYPDVLNCKDGSAKKKEDPARKYCLIQECKALTKDGIVYAYGGKTAYAEYTYTKESVGTGILLSYTLKRCGEMQKEFADKNKCQYYRTSSGLFG